MNNEVGFSEAGLSIINTSAPPGSSVTEAATLLAADLTEAMEQLAETLSSSLAASGNVTWLQALFAIFVVVAGAFSAYGFNYLHWQMVEKRQQISGTRLALSTLISDLESVAVNYWLRDYSEKDQLEIQASEISIKSKIPLISSYTKLITPQLSGNISVSRKQNFENFPLDIYDLATGDGFESVSKKSSKSKAMKISKLCLEIKTTILSLHSCA